MAKPCLLLALAFLGFVAVTAEGGQSAGQSVEAVGQNESFSGCSCVCPVAAKIEDMVKTRQKRRVQNVPKHSSQRNPPQKRKSKTQPRRPAPKEQAKAAQRQQKPQAQPKAPSQQRRPQQARRQQKPQKQPQAPPQQRRLQQTRQQQSRQPQRQAPQQQQQQQQQAAAPPAPRSYRPQGGGYRQRYYNRGRASYSNMALNSGAGGFGNGATGAHGRGGINSQHLSGSGHQLTHSNGNTIYGERIIG